jgi:CheY-like chemotaxis protein
MTEERRSLPPEATITFTVIEGEGRGERHTVSALPADIGAGDEMDLVLEGGGVAASHARLSLSGSELYLEDLGSGGVTRINTADIKRSKLQNGDIIEIGETKLLLQLSLPRTIKLGPAPAPGKDKPKPAPDPGKEGPGPDGPVWAVGFSPQFREWLEDDLGPKLKKKCETFRNGGDVLTALSRALVDDAPPSLLILDLRIPLMNGINIAIAARAFELGFNREEKVPIVFMFPPPKQTSFKKVVKFCQPLQVVAPGKGDDDLKMAARKAIKDAKA